jgi:dCTP deaminase
MAFLNDRAIKGAINAGIIEIWPYTADNVQPASYDMTLGRHFKFINQDFSLGPIDPRKPVEYVEHDVPEGESYRLDPQGFVLASTRESVRLATNIIGRLEGKSSLGRIGLTAHITAGFFDPGFKGYPTLELFNASPRPILLIPGMKICQMSFARLNSHAEKPYGHSDLGSKYQSQGSKPEGSRMHENFKRQEEF